MKVLVLDGDLAYCTGLMNLISRLELDYSIVAHISIAMASFDAAAEEVEAVMATMHPKEKNPEATCEDFVRHVRKKKGSEFPIFGISWDNDDFSKMEEWGCNLTAHKDQVDPIINHFISMSDLKSSA